MLSAVADRAGADDTAGRLMSMVEADFLTEIGWTTTEATVVLPFGHPLLQSGLCLVPSCGRSIRSNGLCRACQRDHLRSAMSLEQFVGRATVPTAGAPVGVRISLADLSDRLVAEVLLGLQERCRAGSKTDARVLRNYRDVLRRHRGLVSITDVSGRLAPATAVLHSTMCRAVARALLHPETERRKDTWDLAAFGFGGYLRFGDISQSWLREATKHWAFDYLPRRRGRAVSGKVQERISAVARLSESLRLQRPDTGDIVTAVSSTDITAFCNRLAFLADTGVISTQARRSTCRFVKIVLDGIRVLGLNRLGQVAAGLADDFTLRRGLIPDDEDDDAGRDLPAEVMRMICEHFDTLEQIATTEVRVAVELLVDTGHRPGEICALPLDCVDRDSDGSPVLVYNNLKSQRYRRRLPIPEATAAVITAQQARVLARFPGAARGELRLLPTRQANPGGGKAISTGQLLDKHRQWLASLPVMSVRSAEAAIDGHGTAARVPFDIAQATLYSYRHSYAQRHADAGVPVDVLRDLMDHLRMDTTQRYYRVGEGRRRQAVERVATMQFDRRGTRIWRGVQVLSDDERVRHAVGEVAVPYGGCSEPANVAAAGTDCPIRFRCVGCGHFRTDASYLPDLEAYLADLLRNRERLLACSVNADAWAQAEAMPSHEEIDRVRALIGRIRAELDDLSLDERTEIEHAVAVVRRGRINLRLTPAAQATRGLRPGRPQ